MTHKLFMLILATRITLWTYMTIYLTLVCILFCVIIVGLLIIGIHNCPYSDYVDAWCVKLPKSMNK